LWLKIQPFFGKNICCQKDCNVFSENWYIEIALFGVITLTPGWKLLRIASSVTCIKYTEIKLSKPCPVCLQWLYVTILHTHARICQLQNCCKCDSFDNKVQIHHKHLGLICWSRCPQQQMLVFIVSLPLWVKFVPTDELGSQCELWPLDTLFPLCRMAKGRTEGLRTWGITSPLVDIVNYWGSNFAPRAEVTNWPLTLSFLLYLPIS
jgi:hypothetical protein